MANLPIYVINLDARRDRMNIQRRQAKLHRQTIRRVPAKDGVEGNQRFPEAFLTDGAKGIWATFLDLVESLKSEGVCNAVVLEDDAILTPSFFRHATNISQNLPHVAAVVQLGYLTESSWRPQNNIWQNLRKVLRPRSRLRSLRARLLREDIGKTDMRAGAHALLIVPDVLSQYLEELEEYANQGLPLDNALVMISRKYPNSFRRVSRSLAFQIPMKSDIPWMRR